MQKDYKKLLDTLGFIIIIGGLIYWLAFGSPFSRTGNGRKAYDEYTQETLDNVDFFQKKVQDGNWVFAANLAASHMKAFRATNDFSHIGKAEEAAKVTLEHEESSSAYTILSSISLTNHEFDQADAYATKALQAAHTNDEKEQSLAGRFDADLALGNISSLQTTLRELQTVAPESYSTLTRQARLVDRVNGDTQKAAELFGQACALINEADDIWTQAWCATQLQTYQLYAGASPETVLKDSKRITQEIYPDFSLALALQAHIAALMENYRTSEKLYRQALKSNEIPEFHLELAELSLLQHDEKKATQAWQDYLNFIGAHRLDSKDSSSAIIHVRGLTTALYGLGNTNEAFEEAKKDIVKRPNDPGAYQTLALLYVEEGQYAEALETSQHISSSLSLTSDEAVVRAIALSNLNKKEEAEKLFAYAASKKQSQSLRIIRIQQRRQ